MNRIEVGSISFFFLDFFFSVFGILLSRCRAAFVVAEMMP